MKQYLRASDIIDWQHPKVSQLAGQLAKDANDPTDVAKRCFEWVRDEIQHSHDFQRNPVTCTASEALIQGTGYCYAKSHLLAALLRANGIPAGICYQRLIKSGDSGPFCLHSLNATYIERHGWYRMDARGNKEGVDARFEPPVERLAYQPDHPGEMDIQAVFTEPLPLVVEALARHDTWQAMYDHLPDMAMISTGTRMDR